jgi:hypothetical protein
VKHEPIRGIDEESGRDEQRGPWAERPGGGRPRDDRAREQHAHQRLGEEPSRGIERHAQDDRRNRRSKEHRPRQQRMPVEQLNVVVHVLVQIATTDERPADRSDRVHREGEHEQDDPAEGAAREPLEPGEGCREPVSGVMQAQAGFWNR